MPTRFYFEQLGRQTPVGETNLPNIVQKVVDLELGRGKRGFGDRGLRLGSSIRAARRRHATDKEIDAAVNLGESIAKELRAARSLPAYQQPSLISQLIPDADATS